MKKLCFAAIFAGIVLFVAGCGDKSKADKAGASSPSATASVARSEIEADFELSEESATDGDKLLDEYEKFLDDYVAVFEKIKSGAKPTFS